MNDKLVSIVLATYNGERYISQQLDSILSSNKFTEIVKEIIITDDGSTDNTIRIIKKYLEKFDVIKLYESDTKSGVIDNFMSGLSKSSGDFIMFCDQDDYWLPEKIDKMHSKILEMQASYGKDEPLLAFSDLKIVDERLNEISPSFFHFNRIIFPESLLLDNLFLNNIAPGCVCIFNRKLATLVKSNDTKKWIMHDWWFLLLASALGHVAVVNEPLMLYRQHSNNVVGAKKKNFFSKIISLRKSIKDYRNYLLQRLMQRKEFYNFLSTLNNNLISNKKSTYRECGFWSDFIWGYRFENTLKRKFLFCICIVDLYFLRKAI